MTIATRIAFAFALLLGSAAPAAAATVVHSYTATLVFDTGPERVVKLDFTLTFDPTRRAEDVPVDRYIASTMRDAFNPAAVGYTNSYSPGETAIRILVGGLVGDAVANIYTVNPDFFVRFEVNSAGIPLPTGIVNAYYASGGQVYQVKAGTVELTAVGAVPEPEAWLLLLAGFGLLAAAIRRDGDRLAAAIQPIIPSSPSGRGGGTSSARWSFSDRP